MTLDEIAVMAETTPNVRTQLQLASVMLAFGMPFGNQFIGARAALARCESHLKDMDRQSIADISLRGSEILDGFRHLLLPREYEHIEILKIPAQSTAPAVPFPFDDKEGRTMMARRAPPSYRFRCQITERGAKAPYVTGEGNTALAAKIAAFARAVARGPSNGKA